MDSNVPSTTFTTGLVDSMSASMSEAKHVGTVELVGRILGLAVPLLITLLAARAGRIQR